MPYLSEVLVANGTTSLGRIVLSKAVLDMITNDAVLTLAVNAGGTGYVVGETFDVDGGTPIGAFVARGVVTAESGGVVSAVKIISAGAYSTLPGVTGQTTSNASAGGNDDLTVDLTTQTARWTEDESDYTDDQTDFEWIATSVKAANEPTIGMKTEVVSGDGAVRMLTASGYNAAAVFDAQPDGSPATVTFLNISGTNPEILLSTTERRVNVVSRSGSSVQYGGFGLFIPLTNVDASYPFPGVCHAQTRAVRAMADQYNEDGNGDVNAGVLHPAPFISAFGPYYFRDNLSAAWKRTARLASVAGAELMIWPHKQGFQDYAFSFAPQLNGKQTNPQSSGTTQAGIFSDNASSLDSGWFEDPTAGQGVSPFGTGSQMSFTVTAHVIQSLINVEVIGFVDGYESVHGIGLTAFEEIESFQSASRFIVFPDTNGSDVAQWVAMEMQ